MMNALQTCVAVAQAGSFSKVARAQGVAVSSITRKIDAVEAELDTALFHRSSRRVVPTEAGEQFLLRAKAILADLADAKADLTASQAEPRGLLTVTAPAAFGRRHVAPAVIEFLKRHPSLEVDLHLSDQIVDLSEQRIDVAVRLGGTPSSELVATRLAPLHRLACASPDYLKRHGRPASPADLREHNCLTKVSLPVPQGWWTFRGFHRNQPLPVRGSLRTDDAETLLQAALAGLGIAHLASWLVSDAIREKRLVPLLTEFEAPDKAAPAIHAVRMPGRSHVAKVQLFIAHLRETFGEVPYWDQGWRRR